MKLSYEIRVTDKNGKVIHREKRVARSWVTNYNHLMYGAIFSDLVTLLDTSGVNRTPDKNNYGHFEMKAAATTYTYGPVIGTDDTPVAMSNTKLGSQIVHGTGAGQMQYLATAVPSPTVTATTSSFTLTRQYINVSGSSVTVREIGIYGRAQSGISRYIFCFARDVLGAPVSVPDGGAFTLIYTIAAVE